MNYEREQKYCVVATVNGVRQAITGPMAKERAETWCMMGKIIAISLAVLIVKCLRIWNVVSIFAVRKDDINYDY
ncbi:MAG: hypothetical protein IKR91_06395 [Alloprevotella sp.]|nr:hypothetical protein [Alloprevotella sp.]